jgi:flagellar motor protein MotB
MKKSRTSLLLIPAIVAFLLVSCVSQQKVTSAKTELSQEDSILATYSNSLSKLDETREVKDKQNELADTVNIQIKKFIDNTNAQIDTLIDQNIILIKGNAVKKEDLNRIMKALSMTRLSSQLINKKIMFLEDLIKSNMVVKLDQDVLFEPGSYKVSPAVIANIGKIFEPVAVEIDKFAGKYSDFALTLVISLKGYADATSINEGSTLYNNLKSRLTLLGREPDAKELNKELSRARAEEVKKLFEKFAGSRSDKGIYTRNIVYIYEGKGEQPPDPRITDYAVNDPRRRIVLLFWSIFPD